MDTFDHVELIALTTYPCELDFAHIRRTCVYDFSIKNFTMAIEKHWIVKNLEYDLDVNTKNKRDVASKHTSVDEPRRPTNL